MDNAIDLNLLRVFEILLEEESTTRAAVRLDVSQAAVSAALARLRGIYDDPLFTRSGRGLAPTPRALELAPDIRRAMDAMRTTLAPGRQRRRHVLIGLSDDVEMAFGAALIERLRREVPDAVPVFRRSHDGIAADLLAERHIDIAVGSGGMTVKGLLRVSLGASTWLGVIRTTAATEAPVDLDDFCARPHLLIASSGLTGMLDTALAAVGRSRTVAAASTRFSAVPFLLEGKMIATLPAHAARAIERLGGFRTFVPPVEMGTAPLELAYRSANTRDAMLQACATAIRAVIAHS